MSIVKITKKEKLDTLLAKITLRLGRKPTQQEVLDFCVELGAEHFEELLKKLNPGPILDDDKINQIITMSKELADVPWEPLVRDKRLSDEDYEIYSH
ncbi:MAG: hypothetical protein ACTSRS_15250 [Candidatus Helarchaeota archaeon]